MPPRFLFQNLKVYQRALDFADQVSALAGAFARPNWYLADQLRRASLSVALNIAESTGRLTGADRRRFLIMARGSAHECVALLDMCERRKLIPENRLTELADCLEGIAKMLAGMLNRLEDGSYVREEPDSYDVQ
ncbi:MAG: four helix bundle protein [Armatimonadota bacterium]